MLPTYNMLYSTHMVDSTLYTVYNALYNCTSYYTLSIAYTKTCTKGHNQLSSFLPMDPKTAAAFPLCTATEILCRRNSFVTFRACFSIDTLDIFFRMLFIFLRMLNSIIIHILIYCIAYYIYVLTCRHFPSLLHSSPVVDLCEWRPHELTSSAVEVIGQLARDTDITEELKYVALPYNLCTVRMCCSDKAIYSVFVLFSLNSTAQCVTVYNYIV